MFKKAFKLNKLKNAQKLLKANYCAITPLTTEFPGVPHAENPKTSDWKAPTVSNVNGVKVVNLDANVPYSFVSLSFNAGSRVENNSNAGVSTFIKQFAYKGTPNYTQVGITRAIELSTNIFKSAASREDVSFNANLARYQIKEFVPLLGEISAPKIREFEIRLLEASVLNEAKVANNNVQSYLVDKFHRVAFRGNALGKAVSPLGSRASLSAENWQEKLHEYRDNFFTKNCAVVVAAGASQEEVNDEVASALDNLPSGKASEAPSSEYVGGESFGEGVGPTNVLFGFKGLALGDSNSHALNLVYTLLGGGCKRATGVSGGARSLLATNVVNNNDSVFASAAYNVNYSDTGLFGVFVHTNGNVENVVDSVAESINKVSKVTEEQLSSAKKQLKVQLAAYYDSSAKRAELAKRFVLAGQNPVSVEQFISSVDSVSLDDVKSVAKSVFGSKPTIVSQGDLNGLPSGSDFTKKLN